MINCQIWRRTMSPSCQEWSRNWSWSREWRCISLRKGRIYTSISSWRTMKKPSLSSRITTTKSLGTTSNSLKNIRIRLKELTRSLKRTRKRYLSWETLIMSWKTHWKRTDSKEISLNLCWDSSISTKWAGRTTRASSTQSRKRSSDLIKSLPNSVKSTIESC